MLSVRYGRVEAGLEYAERSVLKGRMPLVRLGRFGETWLCLV